MKKAIIYARYSSERQTEQSIEGQLTVCNKYAKEHDFFIVNQYIDRATTGTNDHRPAFQQMIRDSVRKEWQYVIVYKGDRFSRNRIESAIYKKVLKDNGVKLVSATENIPDSPEGIILESLLEGMAEYYSAELSQKVKRGMNESRNKKQFLGGCIIYGYDIVKKKPVINQNEADVVKTIFENYAKGQKASEICKYLNGKGIRTKSNRAFTPSRIYQMLKQTKYYSDTTYPPIITDTILIEKINKIMEHNKHAPSRKKSYGNFLLSGKLVCGECGGLMTGESGKSHTGNIYYYYKCFEKKRHTRKCSMRQVKKDEIENKVFEICCKVLNEEFIPRVVESAYKLYINDQQDIYAISNLESLVSEKEKSLKNILKAIEAGVINSTTQSRMVELENEIENLKYQIIRLKAQSEKVRTKEDYFNFLSNFTSEKVANEKLKQYLIDMLIRQVIVFQDKICITFNYSPDPDKEFSKDYKINRAELEEIQQDYNGESSNLLANGAPLVNNPNLFIFVRLNYWGVWTK